MNYKLRTKKGFSLIEVLLAIGTLAVGMIFVAGVFPVAIHFTTIATERTVAAVTADEAFAKIKLYGGIDLNWISNLSPTDCNDFNDLVPLTADEFAYPSTYTNSQKQYYWSALCRLIEVYNPVINPNPSVQVTVFVSRKIGGGTVYWGGAGDRPVAVQVDVGVPAIGSADELVIESGKKTFINDGYTIVDNKTGDIYRVLERYASPNDSIILLDRNWQGGSVGSVWVVPPPAGGGRYPCVAVYQKVIRF